MRSFLVFLTFCTLSINSWAVRDVLISSPSQARILKYNVETGAFMGNFVGVGSGGVNTPFGSAVGPDGNLYVADGQAGKIKRYNGITGAFIDDFVVGVANTPQTLSNVSTLKFTEDGVLHAMTSLPPRISRFDAYTGAFLQQVFTISSIMQMIQSRDFIFHPPSGDYIILGTNGRGQRYNKTTGALVSNFINPQAYPGVISDPQGITIGPDGYIWVSNSGLNNLLRFDATTGALIDQGFLQDQGRFNLPTQIIFDSVYAYVLNRGDRRVHRFNFLTGALIDTSAPFIDGTLQNSASTLYMSFAPENQIPLANAGTDFVGTEFQSLSLNGTQSSDFENQPLSYVWTQISGPTVVLSSTTVSQPSFTAPEVGPGGSLLEFQLLVSDGVRTSAADTVVVTIQNQNLPPVAHAGTSGNVFEKTAVNLDASLSSDPENQPLSYFWQQLSGPTVSIINPTSAQTYFMAPAYTNSVFTFQVTVSDGNSSSTQSVSFGLYPLTDTDSDGMTDAWESLYSLDMNSSADASLDADGDGRSNLQEFTAGTNPRDSQSSFRVLSIVKSPTQVTLTFTSVLGKTYTVEYSDDLSSGLWTPLQSGISAQGGVTTYYSSSPQTGSMRFYRIVIEN